MSGTHIGESPFAQITHPHPRAFLAAFQQTGNVCRASEVAKVGRSSHYRWLERRAVPVARPTPCARRRTHGTGLLIPCVALTRCRAST